MVNERRKHTYYVVNLAQRVEIKILNVHPLRIIEIIYIDSMTEKTLNCHTISPSAILRKASINVSYFL